MPTVFLLPFVPAWWAEAAWLPLWRAALPVYALTFIVSLAMGYAGSGMISRGLTELAAAYERNGWSPIVVSADGEVSVEGDKPPVYEGGNYLFAIDPDNTVDPAKMGCENYLIVGKRKIVQQATNTSLFGGKKAVSRQERDLKELTSAFGGKEIRIDGPSLRAFATRIGPIVRVIAFVFLTALMTVWGWITAPIYALTAAWLSHSFAAKRKGLTFGQCFNVAMAAVAPKVLIDAALTIGGFSFGGAALFLPYVALTTVLTLWAIAKLSPPRISVSPPAFSQRETPP